MNGPLLSFVLMVFGLLALVLWNKNRIKGKLLCFILRKDKSVIPQLCALSGNFVIFESRAFDVYPEFVRITRFPMGWPPILQEIVPSALYWEEDAVPLDWITLDDRKEKSMELRAALDEEFLRKLVHEVSSVGGGTKFNFRKLVPILLLVVGVGGLIFILTMKGGS